MVKLRVLVRDMQRPGNNALKKKLHRKVHIYESCVTIIINVG
jgi:hypothetical protein